MLSGKEKKKVIVVGGPFIQDVDPVLRLVPTGEGLLAASIADALDHKFENVHRVGNFSGAETYNFQELIDKMSSLDADVLVFLPHLPNILVNPSSTKIRPQENKQGFISYVRAPKIVETIKAQHPEVLLIPFKIADNLPTHLEVQFNVVRWMLEIHSALAVYSILGESNQYYIIDALSNEISVSKADLPEVLASTITNFVKAVRRRSERVGEMVPEIKHINDFLTFSRKMQPAFETIVGGNVLRERWPGNFSFRCTYGFISSRISEGFAITVRNIAKERLTEKDFVFVGLGLRSKRLQWSGKEGVKPSIDAPVHRVVYEKLPWVKTVIHGHLKVIGDCVYDAMLPRWPCGAENEGVDIISVAPREKQTLWIVNVEGHGFVALIGDEDPRNALNKLSEMEFERF